MSLQEVLIGRARPWALAGALAVACVLPRLSTDSSLEDERGGAAGSDAAAAGSAMGGKATGGTAPTSVGGHDTAAAGDGTDPGFGGSAGATGVGLGGGADAAGAGGAAEAPLPGCGDGTRTPDETCDDGNLLACGTCSASCRKATPLAPASGTISIGPDAVADGETFVLHDGFGPIPFEFDDDDQLDTDGQVISFSQPLNVEAVRDAIVAAVNAAPGLAIIAVAGDAGTVMLTNEHQGPVGNHAITDLVSSSTFTHTGMSGGAGYDCPEGTGCFNNDSCASARCELGVCVP